MNNRNIANQLVRESITEALLRLMSKKDFSEISISELTKTAGVSRVSFYRNYESKEDILLQHMENTVTIEFGKVIEGTPNASIEQIWETAFSMFQPLLPTIRLLKKSGLSPLFYEFLRCHSEKFKPDCTTPERYMQAAVVGLFFSAYNAWLDGGMKETPAQLARMYQNIRLDSILQAESVQEN